MTASLPPYSGSYGEISINKGFSRLFKGLLNFGSGVLFTAKISHAFT